MGSGVPLTICVAFPNLLTSMLGSWVTLKLGLKQKEWGVLWGNVCGPVPARWWQAMGGFPPPLCVAPGVLGSLVKLRPSLQENRKLEILHQTPGCSGNRGETLRPLLGSSDPILPCLSPPT